MNLPWIEGFKLGVVARNLVGTAKYGSGHTDKFDPVFVAGASMKPIPKLTVAADFDVTSTKGHVGVEYQVIPALAVRAGGVFAQDGDMRFSAGAGFSVQNFTIDYAYQMHTALPDSHWLSLGMRSSEVRAGSPHSCAGTLFFVEVGIWAEKPILPSPADDGQ